MTTNGQTGVDESDPTNKAGEGSDGAADPSKTATVPLSVLEATRADLKGQLARLARENDQLKAGQQKPAAEVKTEKTYTRAQLRAAVTAGTITEDQMDAILDQQTEAKIQNTIREATALATKTTVTTQEANAELAKYTELHPDLLDPDSDLRKKVQVAYDKLVRRGLPENLSTELTAVEMTVGSVPVGRKKDPETHQETGGSGGRDSTDTGTGWAAGLTIPAKTKAHYQKMIDRGIYKGAEGQQQLQAELKIFRAARSH